MAKVSRRKWFDNCGGWVASHDLGVLRAGIASGRLNEQDEYGMTALSLAVMSGWREGVEELLRAGADTGLLFFRTGEAALYMAVQQRNESIIAALVAAGANPDAPNYWGLTPGCRNSGETTQRLGSITKAGSPMARWLLAQVTHKVLRRDTRLRE